MTSPFLARITIYFCVFGLLLFLEWLVPFAKSDQKKSSRIAFHLGISIANSIVLYLLMTQPLISALSFTRTHPMGIAHLFRLTGWTEIVLTVIAFDLWDYWMHRAYHRWGVMWRLHKAHHSDMEIDVTTAARFHIGELILSGISKGLMVLLWGPSLWGLVTFDILLNVAAQFHHSNLGIPFSIQDRIERIFVTPRMHRGHHALHPDCYETNYSAIISFWDRLFRSYHWAREESELTQIGLWNPRGPDTMNLKPFLMTPFADFSIANRKSEI
jgi:sterol desaturase/sphingolipid hydroxylase (fatty acid hydroxylase superfamily)